MNELKIADPAKMGADGAQPLNDGANGSPFAGFEGLCRHLPMYGERSLRELVKRGVIPSIRPPGSRKLAFHLPAVNASLLRYQKGGIE